MCPSCRHPNCNTSGDIVTHPHTSSWPLAACLADSGAGGGGEARRWEISRPTLKLRKCSANSGTDT